MGNKGEIKMIKEWLKQFREVKELKEQTEKMNSSINQLTHQLIEEQKRCTWFERQAEYLHATKRELYKENNALRMENMKLKEKIEQIKICIKDNFEIEV